MSVVMIKKIFTIFLFFVFCTRLDGVKVGSNNSCAKQGVVNFKKNDSDNEMVGFAAFSDGFSMESPTTTCTFNAFFPVSGDVSFNGGTLYLLRDLKFDIGTNFVTFGSIYGGGFSVEFADSSVTLTNFSSQASENASWVEVDSINSVKRVNSVDWSYDDNYVVSIIKDWGGKKLATYSFDGSSLGLVDNIDTFRNPFSIRAHPSGYYFLTCQEADFGYFEIRLFKLSEGTLSLLDSYDPNVFVMAVDWSADGNFAVSGSSYYIRVFSFSSESLTHIDYLNLGAGEQVSQNAIVWDRTGDYIAAGISHFSSSKLGIYYFDGATVTSTQSVSTGSDYVTAVDWSHTGSFVAIGTNGSSNQLRVYEYDSSVNSLTERESISITGEVLSVHWNSDATKLLVSKKMDFYGTEFRVYDFDSSNYVLDLELEEEKTTDIYSARWSNDDNYIAYGDYANNTVVYSYNAPVEGFSGGCGTVLDNVELVFKGEVSWMMSTTVQGECSIFGKGGKVTIEGDGVITVTSGAQLTLENIELKGLTNQTFRCSDDDSSVVFRNCKINLGSDFSFGTGSLLFEKDVVFTGTNKFIYSSQMTSTIASNATVTFDKDTTFKYDPSVANRDLLYMTDRTSSLFLDGCTLHSTETGLRLTKGALFLNNAITFNCEGANVSEAISLGNGVEDENLTVKLLSGADLTVYGALHYNNNVS